MALNSGSNTSQLSDLGQVTSTFLCLVYLLCLIYLHVYGLLKKVHYYYYYCHHFFSRNEKAHLSSVGESKELK